MNAQASTESGWKSWGRGREKGGGCETFASNYCSQLTTGCQITRSSQDLTDSIPLLCQNMQFRLGMLYTLTDMPSHGSAKNTFRISPYRGVPCPVTGSHPGLVGKPSVPHPSLCPTTISLNIFGYLYMIGFKKPMGPLPASSRSSLSMLTILAKMGVEADVPPKDIVSLRTTAGKKRPMAETSGYARPDGL
jgi:hypothetical protein